MCKANTTSLAKRELFCLIKISYYLPWVSSVSTLRSALEVKAVFDQIVAAEKAGNLNPEERKKLEEQAAEKGLQALFKVCILYELQLNSLPHSCIGRTT